MPGTPQRHCAPLLADRNRSDYAFAIDRGDEPGAVQTWLVWQCLRTLCRTAREIAIQISPEVPPSRRPADFACMATVHHISRPDARNASRSQWRRSRSDQGAIAGAQTAQADIGTSLPSDHGPRAPSSVAGKRSQKRSEFPERWKPCLTKSYGAE